MGIWRQSVLFIYFLFIRTQWWRELVAVYNTKYTDWFCLQLPFSLLLCLFHSGSLFMRAQAHSWGSQAPSKKYCISRTLWIHTINVNDMKTGQIDSYRFVSGVILSNQEVDANKSLRIIIEFEKEEVAIVGEERTRRNTTKNFMFCSNVNAAHIDFLPHLSHASCSFLFITSPFCIAFHGSLLNL